MTTINELTTAARYTSFPEKCRKHEDFYSHHAKKYLCSQKDAEHFTSTLLLWYRNNKRSLPWRAAKDPYKIWVSEVILQQTRVQQGLPYYCRFLARFPSLEALQSAQEEEVLALWEGLGYYTRARNLLKGARYITQALQGIFPSTKKSLQRVPGIGEYTAAAIASLAFGERVPVLDGNVYRVIARVFGVQKDVTTSKNKRFFLERLNVLIHKTAPATFNQAIMEFGALQCKVVPNCTSCPLQTSCYAFQRGCVSALPIKKKKKQVKNRYLHYLIFWSGEEILLSKRDKQDIWKGLYEPYCIERSKAATWDELKNALCVSDEKTNFWHHDNPLLTPTRVQSVVHLLTHQRLYIKFFYFPLLNPVASLTLPGGMSLQRLSRERAFSLPMPVVVAREVKNAMNYL